MLALHQENMHAAKKEGEHACMQTGNGEDLFAGRPAGKMVCRQDSRETCLQKGQWGNMFADRTVEKQAAL